MPGQEHRNLSTHRDEERWCDPWFSRWQWGLGGAPQAGARGARCSGEGAQGADPVTRA